MHKYITIVNLRPASNKSRVLHQIHYIIYCHVGSEKHRLWTLFEKIDLESYLNPPPRLLIIQTLIIDCADFIKFVHFFWVFSSPKIIIWTPTLFIFRNVWTPPLI